MRIEQKVIGACYTNVYLVISEQNNAVLIDPADDAEGIIAWIKDLGVSLKNIFIKVDGGSLILFHEKNGELTSAKKLF